MPDERDENGLNETDRRSGRKLADALAKAGVPPEIDVVITSYEMTWPPDCGVTVTKVPVQIDSTPTHGHVFHDLYQKAAFPKLGEAPHTVEYLNDDPSTGTVVVKDKDGHVRCTMPEADYNTLTDRDLYQQAVAKHGPPILKVIEPNRPVADITDALCSDADAKYGEPPLHGPLTVMESRFGSDELLQKFAQSQPLRAKLIALYAEMAEMTLADCKKHCTRFSCCSPEYCQMALERAVEWHTPLEPTGNPEMLLLGPTGCVAAPHLRPLCSLHHCDISSLGFHRTDREWTKRYFVLREKIDRIEWKCAALLG